MTDLLWTLIFIQIAMGGFDTLYHHELTERLAWRPAQRQELRLHGVRNWAYALVFLAFGWTAPQGWLAVLLMAVLMAELGITFWDFVEEDRSRRLPATERVLHTALTLNYGVILAVLFPLLLGWAQRPTALVPVSYGILSWLCTIAAVGVLISGWRDFTAARRTQALTPTDPAPLAAALPIPQSILIAGGTGFIGRRLAAALITAGHDVTLYVRSPARMQGLPAPYRLVTNLNQISADSRFDAVINLAGEPLADGLWTRQKRRRILRSRLTVTRDLVALIRRLHQTPPVFVCSSAIGFYGLQGDDILDETGIGTPCFTREVCVRWERAARRAEATGTRVVRLRTGLVLGAEGGLLSRLLVPFEWGLGGPIGSGRQWMSWIHRDDLVRLIVHLLVTPTLAGPVNGTAPIPLRNQDFTDALGHALHRPAWLPLPAAPLRWALGDFAEELLLSGQRVVPNAALTSGFRFTYPEIDGALVEIVRQGGGAGAARESAHSITRISPPIRE
ncbi:MAG: TIGR01777 family oxidoreductase [Magnetospiraceae bacterium]